MLDRGRALPLRCKRGGEIVETADEIRIARERLSVRRDGVVQSPLLGEHIAEIVMRLGRARCERDYTAVAGLGLVQSPEVFQQIAEIGVRVGIIRFQRYGAPIMFDRLFWAAKAVIGVS